MKPLLFSEVLVKLWVVYAVDAYNVIDTCDAIDACMYLMQSIYHMPSMYEIRSMNDMPHVGADTDRMKHRMSEASDWTKRWYRSMYDIQSMYGMQSMHDVRSMYDIPHVGADTDRMKLCLGEDSDRTMHYMGEDSARCMIYDRMHVVHPCIIMTHAISRGMLKQLVASFVSAPHPWDDMLLCNVEV